MKKKILLSAYAISPYRGSEYAVAWNAVTVLARQHDVWVLYGMSDDHMGDTQTLRKYIKDNPTPSVNFVEVGGGRIANAINLLNKIGIGWFFYPAYYIWQKKAFRAAAQILNTVDIDVIHQLGPIGFREPGFLWQFNKPMVWGPIGGMHIVDKRLLKDKPLLTRLKFLIKNGINHIQLNYSKRIKQAFANAGVLIAATVNGQRIIMEKFGRESHYQPESMIMRQPALNWSKFNSIHDRLQFVWSGSHIHRKNLQLCINALANVKHTNWVLNVLGTGPLTGELQQLAVNLNLSDRIIWHGHLSHGDAIRIVSQSHLHIITSIAEDNTAVLFEAMSHGVPTLTIDHCGMGNVVSGECGIKIPLADCESMAADITAVLSGLLANSQALINLGHTTLKCAQTHVWDERLAKLNDIYDEAIAVYEKRTGSFIADQNLIAV